MRMRPGIQTVYGLFKEKKVKQILSLYSSMVLGLILGIIISIINTRFLGPELYGDFKFIHSIFATSIPFFTLGIFYSASRLIIQNKHSDTKQDIIGCSIIIGILISVIFSGFILGFSFWEDKIFNNNLGLTIRMLVPFAFAYPFDQLSQNLLQGDNKIYELSIYRLGQKVFYLFFAYFFHVIYGLSLQAALIIYFLSFVSTIIFAIDKLKPHFTFNKDIFLLLKAENKIYGIHVYFGALWSFASAHLGALVIGYFIDNVNVGFYSLAITATTPLTLIPSTIGTTFFKDFNSMNKIPNKVFFYTVLISVFSLVLFIIFIEKFVVIFYTKEFISVGPLAIIISFGSVLHGLGDFFNRFLSAHGKGKILRNSNIAIGIANILGFFILIKLIGVKGAAITKIISGLTYLGFMLFYYRRFKLNIN